MKLNVPFYAQESPSDCGPTVLRMALEFLSGKKQDYATLCRLVDPEKKGVTFSLGLAKAAQELGYKTEFYTTALEPNPEVWNLDFAKENTAGFDASRAKILKLLAQAKALGARVAEKSFPLAELLARLSSSTTIICLVDWSKVTGAKSFHGHFVPIVGYDEEFVYVHTEYNIGTKEQRKIESRPFFAIPRNTFDEARKSFGTDEDTVVISKQ